MHKIKVTQRQRDNALEARDVMWPSVPPKNVYPRLGGFRRPEDYDAPSCGTVACFGGWCAWWPNFQAQGIRADLVGAPVRPGGASVGSASDYLFGHPGLFLSQGGFAGTKEVESRPDVSAHIAVSMRLDWLIENSEVVPDHD